MQARAAQIAREAEELALAAEEKEREHAAAYSKLRGQAVKHITDAMPRLADLVERHAS